MRNLIKKIIAPFLKKYSKWYFSKPRKYNYSTVKGTVLPGVFHPQFTISTKLLMQYISGKNLQSKSVLELGCGSGLVSVFAAQQGSVVTATDINPKAIENTRLNASNNQVELKTILSDLFEKIPSQTFDYIVINPPYYPKAPQSKEEEAWFCGENFEYFKKLFPQLKSYFNTSSTVIMILSEDCELDRIKEIALSNNLKFELEKEQKVWGEKNYIFHLKSV